jgi:hypothetical protein
MALLAHLADDLGNVDFGRALELAFRPDPGRDQRLRKTVRQVAQENIARRGRLNAIPSLYHFEYKREILSQKENMFQAQQGSQTVRAIWNWFAPATGIAPASAR